MAWVTGPRAEAELGRVVCAGGCVIDRKLWLTDPPVAGTSNPARAVTSFGGVARNVAENLARLGTPVALVSRVGDDDSGRAVSAHLAALGADVSGVNVALSGETAQYIALLGPDGELVLGAAAMDVLDGLAPADLDRSWPDPAGGGEPAVGDGDGDGDGGGGDGGHSAGRRSSWVFADCNLPIDTLAHAVRRGRLDGTNLAVDAVSTRKVGRLPRDLTGITVLFCNGAEAEALARHHGWPTTGNILDLVQLLHEHGAAHVVLCRGGDGVVIADENGTRFLPATAASVYDVTGAGDSLIAGTLTLLVTGVGLDDAVLAGTLVAALTVESQYSVRPDLSADLVDAAALHRLRRPDLIASSRVRVEDAAGLREPR